ncbi:hypothetical protein C8Q78DRAFT_499230 [Trametes maxima]|nr:hypothetical protein C8Q78DRAFT_499230 [Trametes maxima]
MISITVAPAHSSPLASPPPVPSPAHTSPLASSPMMVIVFAAVFLLLVFILVGLSVLAIVRRYRCSSVPAHLDQTLSASTADWDIEAHGRDISFTEKEPPAKGFSALYVWAFSWSGRRSLGDTSGDGLPLPVSASSSAGGATLARRLTGALRSSLKKSCLKIKAISCIAVYGLLTLARKSWHVLISYDAELEADRLIPRPFFIGEAPRIIITKPSDDDIASEVSSPASTYSEPDSPTVETPILGSPIDVRVYEGTFEGDCPISVQVAEQVEDHSEDHASTAYVEPSKEFLVNAYGFGFESYEEEQEKGDRLIGAFVSLLSSESLSDEIEDGGDDGNDSEDPCEARLEDTTSYIVGVEPALKHADSCSAIVHWWNASSLGSCLEGIADKSGHLEADASFYSCSSASFARDTDEGGLRCDFALSPATSGEVYYDCYG